MTSRYLNLLFTPSIRAEQERQGSRRAYARGDAPQPERDLLDADVAYFIAQADSFYMATVGASGWPYMQHRGGPPGFVKVLAQGTIGFADYRGNRQYVSVGNLADDDRVSLFFMDYGRRARLKVLGRARIVDLAAHPDIAAALIDRDYKAHVERGMLIDVEAFDWNCPQHITQRVTDAQLKPVVEGLKARIAELERQIAVAAGGVSEPPGRAN